MALCAARGNSAYQRPLAFTSPRTMSAVIAGFSRGVAEEIDAFLRPLPMGVEVHRLTGCRVTVLRDEIMITCNAETARVLWDTYEDVHATVRQFVVIEGVTSWSNETEAGVRRAGSPFPPFHSFTRRWRGRVTTVDAEFTVGVRVPANRILEHRRWLAAGGLAAIRASDPPETPEEDIPLMIRGEAVAAGIRFMAVLRR